MRLSWSRAPGAAGMEAWDGLHAAAAAPALLARAFVEPLLAHCARGDELVMRCSHAGRTVAMAVARRGRTGAWETFQPAQAPLGLWLQLPEYDTGALVEALLGALPGFPLLFALTQVDPMLMARPADGPSLRTLDYIDTARITLDGGFDAYWERRGKNLRSNLRKQRGRLEREGIPTRLETVRDAAAMAGAVADYSRLEGAGWKARGGTAVGADDAQGRYYRAMLEAMAVRGAARVMRYHVGGRLAAMDLCVEDDDSIVVLKTAYDEDSPAWLSPALLMREEALRAVFAERRFRRLEFYGRIMEWHTRWTDEARTMYHVNYYRWPALRRLHAALDARRGSEQGGAAASTDERTS